MNEDGNSFFGLCFFLSCPTNAEWKGGEGTCLAFNSAQLPLQASLQG